MPRYKFHPSAWVGPVADVPCHLGHATATIGLNGLVKLRNCIILMALGDKVHN